MPWTASSRRDSNVSALIEALRSEGYEAGVPVELDDVRYHDRRIDPDTGAITPSLSSAALPTGTRGLYFLVLRSFPVAAWQEDLASRGVHVVEPLPPAAYIVRGDRVGVEGLPTAVNYVRGAFAVAPEIKKALFGTARSPSPFTHVSIQAVEETPQDSIRQYLDSVSQKPVSERRNGIRVRYEASISDIDIEVLTI